MKSKGKGILMGSHPTSSENSNLFLKKIERLKSGGLAGRALSCDSAIPGSRSDPCFGIAKGRSSSSLASALTPLALEEQASPVVPQKSPSGAMGLFGGPC